MGDLFQTIVATRVSPEHAQHLRGTILQFLISLGVVDPEISDCILGEGEGHRPGPNHSVAMAEADPYLPRLATNGVVVEIGRVIALDPQGETVWRCAACNTASVLDEVVSQAISAWYDGDDDAAVTCSNCLSDTPLVHLASQPPMAFGNLAITFWNWPTLKTEFLRSLERTIGSSITLVYGKL